MNDEQINFMLFNLQVTFNKAYENERHSGTDNHKALNYSFCIRY